MSYRGLYHATPKEGWANDPNGFSIYKDTIHLFFQHYPYDTEWGPMHWGHFTSLDFLHWKEEEIAISPDKEYDSYKGCFSGTAIEHQGELYLVYTGVDKNENQQQCFAKSKDGIHFEKLNINPIISSTQVPPGSSIKDFRDPSIFIKNGKYYMLIGSKTEDYGNILLYESIDMFVWNYIGPLFLSKQEFFTTGVCECPDYKVIDGRDVLIFSPQNMPQEKYRYQNQQVVVACIGSLDFATGHFSIDSIQELDQGFDFYAAQCLKKEDRTILIAWKELWNRTYPTKSLGYVGSFTLPRELRIIDNHLYQKPIGEIKYYYQNKEVFHKEFSGFLDIGLEGTSCHLSMKIDLKKSNRFEICLFKGATHSTNLIIDRVQKEIILDRTNSGIEITSMVEDCCIRKLFLETKDILDLELFLDRSSIEVFVLNGKYTMTANVYPNPDEKSICFVSDGTTIFDLVKEDINI